MANVKVKNKNGDAGDDNFLRKWEKKTGKTAKECSNINCKKTDNLVGGHVIKVGDDNKWYVVPICKECNHFTNKEEYYVPSELLVLHTEL